MLVFWRRWRLVSDVDELEDDVDVVTPHDPAHCQGIGVSCRLYYGHGGWPVATFGIP